MTTVAALILVGTPATSVWPLEGLPAQGGVLFQGTPTLNGQTVTVTSCGGTSPIANNCGPGQVSEATCKAHVCFPNVHGGLAYTGSITSQIWGKDRYGVDRYIAWTCSYIADGSTSAGGVISGGCSASTNAPYECNRDISTGAMVCGNYLWGPFALRGFATPPVSGTAPLGQWTTTVEYS